MTRIITLIICALMSGSIRLDIGTVTKAKADTVSVSTTDGNLWKANTDGFRKGDTVICVFATNGNNDVTDDQLIWLTVNGN